MESTNILTAYCFLASLTENQNDLYNNVYVPICKRTLSYYSLNNSSSGTADDIKKLILNQYGIDVPLVVVRKLLKSVESALSKRIKKESNFKTFSNGNSFQIEKFAFVELEESYKRGERNANALQKAFEEYISREGLIDTEVQVFSKFLDKNKNRLSAFFATGRQINGTSVDKIFIYHVQFLEYIEINNHSLYKIAENLYLGSIVAGFLESGLELESKFVSNEIYYLDTPIVLRALDLQKEEETKPVQELLDLIRKTGGTIKLLSITVDEISGIINKSITSYNNSTPTSTINEAVLRIGKNKTWLISLNGKLDERLSKELELDIVSFTQLQKEKFSKSPDVKALKGTRLRKGTADHDVLSYLYVRERRNGFISSFQKAKEWFLTSNKDLLNFNIEKAGGNAVSEIILPDVLTSLLWLRNPCQLANMVKSVGLSEMMAITLEEEIASKELINEFDINMKLIDNLKDDEYRILLESVAHQSAKNIEKLNELIFNDKQLARIEAQKIVEKERTRRRQTQEKIKEAQSSERTIKDKNEELIYRLELIESELKEVKTDKNITKTQLELLVDEIDSQKAILTKYKKRLFMLGIPSLILFILVILFHDKMNNALTILTGLLTASGWVWGLGSFIINAYRLNKGK